MQLLSEVLRQHLPMELLLRLEEVLQRIPATCKSGEQDLVGAVSSFLCIVQPCLSRDTHNRHTFCTGFMVAFEPVVMHI